MIQFIIPPIIYFFGYYTGFKAVTFTEIIPYIIGYVVIFVVLKIIKLFV